jgi:nucleoside-diphosphate-sugar epimerase
VGVEATPVLAHVTRDAGVARLVHVSTAGVYDRSPNVGDLAEDGPLLHEGSGDYADTKNATDPSTQRPAAVPSQHLGVRPASTAIVEA